MQIKFTVNCELFDSNNAQKIKFNEGEIVECETTLFNEREIGTLVVSDESNYIIFTNDNKIIHDVSSEWIEFL